MLWLVPVLGFGGVWVGNFLAFVPFFKKYVFVISSTVINNSPSWDGLDASGSLIFLAGRKSQSSSREPAASSALSIRTLQRIN